MAVTLNASGTQTATVTTEHFLASPNVQGKFRLYVDLVNMAAGDVVELRAYKMVLTSGTQRVIFYTSFSGAQNADALIAMSEAISNTLGDTNAIRFSLKQTFGTGRNFPYSVINEEDTTYAAMRIGTAQAGGNTSITLDSSATATTDFYKGSQVVIMAGTGIGQGNRVITAYNSSTKVATVTPAWATNPDSTSLFAIMPASADLQTILGTAVSTPATGGILDVNLKNVANAAVSTSTAQIGVNAVNLGGTAQTGRDIGASVLLSSGAGTGQLDFTSGVVKANLAQILGTALTETAGLLAGGFKKFFNIATPTGTLNSIPDAVAGAAGGLFIAGSNAATTANITGNLTGNVTGSVGSVTGAVGSVTGNVGGNIVGSVASVTGAVGSLTTNNDKTGYALSSLESLVIHSGTAQAGAAGSITLAAGASATDSLYVGEQVKLYGGTGAGQVRTITAYVGSTKVATVGRNWAINPDVTTTYAIQATSSPKVNDSLEVTASAVNGNVTGSVASVTGAVGSVTGAVGSVTGNVGGNVVGSVASVTGAVGSVTGAVGSVTGNVGGNVVGSVASVTGAVGSVTGAVGSVTGAVGSVTGNVGGNVVGSVASVTGAVGSVTGNVGGNVVGSVASVTGAVGSVTGNVSGSVASVVAGVTLAGGQIAVKKNVALTGFQFPMYSSAGAMTAGLTVTAKRSLDGAAFASCANAVVELGSGWYKINLAATDLNANSVGLEFAASGAITTSVTIATTP